MALALPSRVVTRNLLNFDLRLETDLLAGVLTLVVSREGEFSNYRGREAQLGKLSVVLVGQLKVAESALPSEVEDAEFAFAEQVKTFLQGVLPVQDALLQEVRFSGQLEAPYGWFAMDVEVWA